MTTPRVLVRYDVDGDVSVMRTEGVDVIYVDENSLADRVYRSELTFTHEELDEVINNG